MRRPTWIRWLAPLLALWLPLFLADGGMPRGCSDGSGRAGPMAAHERQAPRGGSHDGPGSGCDHGACDGPEHCSLLHHCGAAVALATPPIVRTAVGATTAPRAASRGRTGLTSPVGRVDVVLPFATAPPEAERS